jgi:hypothetical protein
VVILLEKDITETKRIRVIYDEDFYYCIDSHFDFENEQERSEFKKKIDDEILTPCIAILLEKCNCCGSYTDKDSLSGIVCETPEEAITVYLQNIEEAAL